MMPAIAEALTVTFFPNYQAFEKAEEQLTLKELAARIKAAKAPTKAEAPWLKLAGFGERRTEKNCLRSDGNLLMISGVEADYDGARLEFYKAVDIARGAGLTTILYTSASHRPEVPRWRILAPTSENLEPQQRATLLARLHGLYASNFPGGGDVFAPESWTLSQSYYYGRIARSPHYRVELVIGTPIDLRHDLDRSARGRPGSRPKHFDSDEPNRREPREDAELIRRVISGVGFHVELAALAARYLGRGVDPQTVRGILEGLMLTQPEGERDARWHDRYKSIGILVASAARKFIPEADRRRSIAALTHRLIRVGHNGLEIKAALVAEAARLGMDQELVLGIGRGILHDLMEGRRHG
jgi:hypothetical protein